MHDVLIRHFLTAITVMNAKYESTINYTRPLLCLTIYSVNITLVRDLQIKRMIFRKIFHEIKINLS